MAFKTKFIFVVFMAVVLLCLVMMEEASDCKGGHACFHAKAASQQSRNRKILAGLGGMGEVLGGTGLHGPKSTENSRGKSVSWELRKVPSGPDPLHHNGGGPKKPRTP